jgi:hypothetical protein
MNGIGIRVARVSRFVPIMLLAVTLAAQPVIATTHLSVEPIPSGDVVRQATLDTILTAGYGNLERWSKRLLNECTIVQRTIAVLTADGVISTINPSTASVLVAAGGFEGVTNPSFVFTLRDTGSSAASHADIDVLSHALGYVLNQGGTAHFSPDNPKAYDFTLDYAVVSFSGMLSGEDAKAFFDHLGTIDAALWSGQFAGFTQITFGDSSTNNSMLFLKPATSKQRLITGLSAAVEETALDATYVTLNNNGHPSTDKAGLAFPGNDWIAFPAGDQYLSKLEAASPRVLRALAALRREHLEAVDDLVAAIEGGTLDTYLTRGFTCPVP